MAQLKQNNLPFRRDELMTAAPHAPTVSRVMAAEDKGLL